MSTLFATLLLLAQTAAQDPAADLSQQVRRLVRQLDAKELTERDEAERLLTELGPPGLAHFPPATARLSAEARQRLDRIRAKLERGAAEASVEPSKVTLAGQDLPLSNVLAAIEKQTGNKLVDQRRGPGGPAAEPLIDANFKATPFWEALDDVLDQAELTVYGYAAGPGLAIVPRPADQRKRKESAIYRGAFRLEPTGLTAIRDLRRQDASSLQIKFELAWEPRLAPILVQAPLANIEAVFDDGSTSATRNLSGRWEATPAPGSSAVELLLALPRPAGSLTKITSLKGKVLILTPGEMETFSFTDLPAAKNNQQKKARATVTVDRTVKNGDVWEVRMRLRYEQAAGALDSHRGWMFNNEAYLLDPAQKKLDNAGFETILQSADEIGIAYVFPIEGGLAGHTFVYKTPAIILDVPVEFEFKDLELP